MTRLQSRAIGPPRSVLVSRRRELTNELFDLLETEGQVVVTSAFRVSTEPVILAHLSPELPMEGD